MNTHPYDCLTPDLVINGPGAGIALRKGEDELKAMFNTAIDAIRANGKYEEINKQLNEHAGHNDKNACEQIEKQTQNYASKDTDNHGQVSCLDEKRRHYTPYAQPPRERPPLPAHAFELPV